MTLGRPKTLEDAQHLSLRVPRALLEAVRAEAERQGLTVGEVARRALVAALTPPAHPCDSGHGLEDT